VPLESTERLFERLHRLDPSVLDPARREATRRAWAARMVAEYRSMVVFAEMLARFPEVGLPLAVVTAATRLVQDESRHTELCGRVAGALGGHGDATLDPRGLRLFAPELDPWLFVARWTLSMLCVGETTSVALLDELRRSATDPCVRVVLRIIHRDETLHDRFGWALARCVLPRLDDDQREWLAADLAVALAHYERVDADCLRGGDGALPPAPEVSGPNLGAVPVERFAHAFYRALDGVALPRLETLGVSARAAWAHRHEVLERVG
jgi:hypothetical protein